MRIKKLAVTAATMAAMTAAAVPAYAQEQAANPSAQQYGAAAQGQQQVAPQQHAPQGEEVSVTGVIERLPSDGGPSPYGITDEASGERYILDRGEGGFSAYEGQRVTVTGTAQDLGAYENLDVADIRAAQGAGTTGPAQGEKGTATLSFEVKTDCAPPEGTTLLGYVPAEGLISAVLSDPDGDGVYTGSADVPKFAPGPRPEGTEPVSVPVVIGQNVGDDSGNIQTIKDFGQVKLDGDKSFSADAAFCAGSGSDQYGPEETSGIGGGTTIADEGTTSGGADETTGPEDAVSGTEQANEKTVAVVSGGATDANKGGSASVDGNGSVDASGGAAKGSASSVAQSSTSPIASVLPSTGGVLPVAGLAGLALVAGGLLFRRISR